MAEASARSAMGRDWEAEMEEVEEEAADVIDAAFFVGSEPV